MSRQIEYNLGFKDQDAISQVMQQLPLKFRISAGHIAHPIKNPECVCVRPIPLTHATPG